MFLGAFEFTPTIERPFWIYATSGHSNPWDDDPGESDPNGPSGAGVEFLLATVKQGEWAIRLVLSLLGFDLLLRAGRYPGKPPLGPGDRVPLGASINGDETCLLRNVLITHAADVWPGFTLPSGLVQFLTLTGASDAEIAYAKTTSTSILVEALGDKAYYPVTDTDRSSLL